MGVPRFIAIHGHFYQPPRENPWLETVEVQDAAAPYHDWNARITAECYAPNSAARRVRSDDQGNSDVPVIFDIVNNFEKISFNIGPTLFAWLERQAPDTYAKILEADRTSVRARGGHGNAIAQVYNHMIMPLATWRDKVTQVRWGLADFRARYGREPEGMWLPETAVDDETLAVLADEGLRFTILAPNQAARVREIGATQWQDVGDRIDPSRAYLWRGPAGHELAIFFYDGPISRAIAFDNVLESGERLVGRLHGAFSDARPWPELVHCATDGESYGHHSRFGEMALAAAVQQIEAEGFAALTNYGQFLAAYPPRHEVTVEPRTSWSCAHGVERWRSDCGCRIAPATHQRWRAPLRSALDWLRDRADAFYEARGAEVFKDPWAARDDYVEVVLDREPAALRSFLARHERGHLDPMRTVDARRLLELQRNRLLMYTSCGWFFDELSALEPVQILRYAAMALQLLRDLGGSDLEPDFEQQLGAAETNAREFAGGRDVYRRLVRPAVVDLERVAAHYAISGLFDEHPDDARVYAYRVRRLDEARESYDQTAVRAGHVHVESDITGATSDVMYAVLHFGGHDFSCGVRAWDADTYPKMTADLLARYARYSMADMVRGMDQWFPGEPFSLSHLFLEERRRILSRVLAALLDKHEETYRRIWEESRKLVHYLKRAEAPTPDTLAIAARHVLEQEVARQLQEAVTLRAIPRTVGDLVAEARALGLPLDLESSSDTMHRAIRDALDAVGGDPSAERVATATALIAGARELGLSFGLWSLQNEFFDLWRRLPRQRAVLEPLGDALGFALPRENGPGRA